jgi:hypothetical protein
LLFVVVDVRCVRARAVSETSDVDVVAAFTMFGDGTRSQIEGVRRMSADEEQCQNTVGHSRTLPFGRLG